MAKGIKGITVEIGGNTEPLQKALKGVNSKARELQSELKQVNQGLKFDSKNVELAKQKQQILKEEIAATKEKLDALKKVQNQVLDKYRSGKIDNGQYRAFQREIINAESKLKDLKRQDKSVTVIGKAFQSVKEKAQQVINKLDPMASGLKKVGAAASKITGAGVKTVGTAVNGAGKALAVYTGAATAAGVAVAAFGAKGLQTASDLKEVQNVVDTTFGSDSKKIDEWSQKASSAYGLSELSAKQYNGTMGAMLKSTGLSGDSVTEMSTKMTGLAGDMASFYNLDSSEAFDKIRQGIAGETEGLKALGINMSQTNLESFAMSQGINKSWSEMSQAEQTTLRYNYIMNATKDAQGDFAKTSGSLANQMRIAKLKVSDLSTSFGSALMPAASGALSGIMTLADQSMPSLNKAFEGLGGMLTGQAGAADMFSQNVTTVVNNIVVAAQNMMPQITQVLQTALPALLSGFNTVLIGLINVLVSILPVIVQTVLPSLITGLTNLVSSLVTMIPTILPLLVQGAITLFMGLMDGLNKIIPQLVSMMPKIINIIGNLLIKNAPKLITSGMKILINLIKGITKSLPALIKKATALIPVITKALTDCLPDLITAGIELIVALAKGLPEAIPAIINALPEIIDAIITGFSEQDWPQIGKDVLSGIAGGLVEGVKAIGGTIEKVASSVVDGFKNFFGIKSPSRLFKDEVGQYLAMGLGEGFTDKMDSVAKDMKASVPTDFEIKSSTTTGTTGKQSSTGIDYNKLGKAVSRAMSGVSIEMDKRKLGRVVSELA